MKVAITGKGGTGKTTIAGILSRTLAGAGNDVVAVDADPNPNLGVALGMGLEAAARLDSVTNVLLREKADHEHAHDDTASEPETAEALLARLGATAPDGVRLIQTGIIERPSEGCLCCGSHRTSRRIFDELHGSGRVVVADLEAGVIDLLWVWPKPEDCALVVTEPYVKSLEVARRALDVAREFEVGRTLVVANRVSGRADAERVRKFLPGYDVVEVPEDPSITRASEKGVSPVDESPASPAVVAVRAIADAVVEPDVLGAGAQARST